MNALALILLLASGRGQESTLPTPRLVAAETLPVASNITRPQVVPPRPAAPLGLKAASSTTRPCPGRCISFGGTTWTWSTSTAAQVQYQVDACNRAPVPCPVVATGQTGQGVTWFYAHDRTWYAPLHALAAGARITLNGQSYRVVRTVEVVDSPQARVDAQLPAGRNGLVLQTCSGALRIMVTAVRA